MTSVAWKGDQVASGSRDNTVIIWDAASGQQLSTLKGHTGWVMSVTWSPKGDQLASASNDKSIIIWDAASGQQLSILKGHTHAVNSVAWGSTRRWSLPGSDL